MQRDWINWICCVFIGMFIICALAMTFGSGDPEYESYRKAQRQWFDQKYQRDREERDRGHDRRASIFSFGGER